LLDKLQKNTQTALEFLRTNLSQVTSFTQKLVSDLFSAVKSLKIGSRLPKKPVKFIKRYSVQISFGVILALFLTVSVGEGQAYQVGAADFSGDANLTEAGFIGKPQILGTQTILTGEVTQVAVINYTVEKGDTVLSIANRYNLSVGTLLDANNLKATDFVKVGSNIVIPAEDSNTSLAWLDQINQEKARQQKLADDARQKQLALQQKNKKTGQSSEPSFASYNGSYQVLGRFSGSYNGGLPGWCTWWAHNKRPDLRASGNARDYLRTAQAAGMATGSVARPGAIFVDGESGWGHVGYVESVSGGMMTITEMNYAARYVVDRRTVPVSLAWGFIY